MWLGFNGPRSKAVLGTWDARFESYRANLKTILPQLRPSARRFLQNALVLHDGTLTRMELGDRISDAVAKATRNIANHRKLTVRLFVLSDTVDQRCYLLEYRNVKRIDVNFPGKVDLFPIGMYTNFGDWGYDELTSPEKGLFRHEVLFSSGLRLRSSSEMCLFAECAPNSSKLLDFLTGCL